MKKTKLLLASPLLVAPIVATLPLVTSCSNKNDISVGGEIAKHVEIDSTQQSDSITIHMTVKDEGVFLPNKLGVVKVGGEEVKPFWNTNDYSNYYVYTPEYNNTDAYLFIKLFKGSVYFEGDTTTLKSISAKGIDVTGENIVEFEVGEQFKYNTPRISVTALMENRDKVPLDGDYTIELADSKMKPGYVFKKSDITSDPKEATIKFGGKKIPIAYSIIAETSALMTYTGEGENPKITKHHDISNGVDGAVEKYNEASKAGDYTISVLPGDYVFENAITIKQKPDTTFTLTSAVDPFVHPEYPYFRVTFTTDWDKLTDSNSLINITTSETSAITNSEINISGIEFETPKTETKATETFNHISIDATASTQLNNIIINECNFIGDDSETNTINAIVTNGTTYLPKNIDIVTCIGSYLNTLFTGSIAPDNVETNNDFEILDCGLVNCKQLFDIDALNITARIALTYADLMWNKDGTKSSLAGGMTIKGKGTYAFDVCIFNQLNETSSANGAIVYTTGTTAVTGDYHNLMFNNCYINGAKHDVFNGSQDVWKIFWNNDETPAKELAINQYWSHPE